MSTTRNSSIVKKKKYLAIPNLSFVNLTDLTKVRQEQLCPDLWKVVCPRNAPLLTIHHDADAETTIIHRKTNFHGG